MFCLTRKRGMGKKLFELSVRIDHKNTATKNICSALLGKVFGLDRVSELLEDGKIFLLVYDQHQKALEKVAGVLIQYGFLKKEVVISRLRESDWKTQWKKDFQALQLTDKIMVVPTWQKKKFLKNKKEKIYIDSTVAFGTGLHSTTQFMARLIEQQEGAFESFLDIGTGTGILTLVALKNGARKVKAIDIDKEAVKVAKANFVQNGYNPSVVYCRNIQFLKGIKAVDFVAANLMTQDLIKYKQPILRAVKPGKFLAVSGISVKNLPLLLKTFQKLPLKIETILKNKQWSAVLFRRNMQKEVSYGSRNSSVDEKI